MISSFDLIDPKLLDQHSPATRDGHHGYTPEQQAGDTRDVLMQACGAASREFPKELWIEPRDWAAKAKENDENHTWPVNFCDRFTNQNPNHFCTCHSLGTNFEICRNRQRGIIFPDGPKVNFRYEQSKASGSVWVSPMSVYSEANPREWGGASIKHVMDICIRRGFLPDKIQPAEYGFKHTLAGTTGKGGLNQSNGQWTRVSEFPNGWQETAKNFRILDVIFPESGEQVMCLILHGFSVCVGRSGHAVPYALANIASKAIGYIDSYDVIRWDSWNTVRGCANGSYAIASVTVPDDWSKPGQ